MSNHFCDAIVVCCIDFRFQKHIRNWTDENLKGKTFDLVGLAGSTKDFDAVLEQIDISVSLHHTKEAILIHHEECGAYGAESTLQRHTQDLHKAREIILSKYTELKILLYYLHLNGTFEEIK